MITWVLSKNNSFILSSFLFLLLIIILAVSNLFWLIAGIILVTTVFYLLQKLKTRLILYNASFFIVLLLTAISVRLFVFEVYLVPSESMEDYLRPGDYILTSKLDYGPNIPRSFHEIPWLDVFFRERSNESSQASYWLQKRLSGRSVIKRNDILVFKSPQTFQTLVKRCVALPGETIEICNKEISINNLQMVSPKTVKYSYWITTGNYMRIINEKLLGNASTVPNFNSVNGIQVQVPFNKTQIDKLLASSSNLRITRAKDTIHIFPWNKKFQWTKDNFGSIQVPYKGLTIPLNKLNYILYKHVFNDIENAKIKEINGIFIAGENNVKIYTFKENYYFVLGDNRDFSMDSRYIGFIPEGNIVGNAKMIVFPGKINDKISWRRMFEMT